MQEMTENLSVLHIAPIGENQASGMFYSVPNLVEALHENGIITALITTCPEQRYRQTHPYPVAYYKDIDLKDVLASGHKMLPHRPNLVVFHNVYVLAHARIAQYCMAANIPYVITPRGGMTWQSQHVRRYKKLAGNLLFFNKMVRNAAALHFLTDNEAVNSPGWNRSYFVASNGIDLPCVETCHGKPRSDSKIVFLGRLDVFYKGLDLLVKACAIIQDDLRNHRRAIYLYGPVCSDTPQLKKLIARHQLTDIVQVRGPVYGQEKAELLRSAELFIHTSRSEGHPVTVLEALSFGIPCLLTPGTNMASEVARAGAGWKVNEHPTDIAEGLANFLATPYEVRLQMSENARHLAERDFSWNSVARKLIINYGEIIKKCHTSMN